MKSPIADFHDEQGDAALPVETHHVQERLTSFYLSGDRMRSRSVGGVVLSGTIDAPPPPARLLTDWEREVARLGLEPGDVEALSLARARARWPNYRHCVGAASEWMHALGLPDLLTNSEIALMACRGAKYHHDAVQYGGAAFCNLFLSEDKGLDVHFPSTGQRIALTRGTVMVFDTGQPHAVIRRHSSGFDTEDFASGQDCTQIFLTWELPIEDPALGRVLQVALDVAPSVALQLHEEQVWMNGERTEVCPDSGRWCRAT